MKSILIIDDDPKVQKMLKGLCTALGFAVSQAEDLEQAESFVAEKEFNFFIWDFNLPGDKDTAELIRKVTAMYPNSVSVAGSGQEENRKKQLEAGCSRSITKPVIVSELKAALAA